MCYKGVTSKELYKVWTIQDKSTIRYEYSIIMTSMPFELQYIYSSVEPLFANVLVAEHREESILICYRKFKNIVEIK